ncbi:18712_t:CDS:2 [Entrophospora sp. SA101]|nr:18712_t:CDS:2 [Entrophospora sp. SA101]
MNPHFITASMLMNPENCNSIIKRILDTYYVCKSYDVGHIATSIYSQLSGILKDSPKLFRWKKVNL